jgi:hypothetical protein
MFPHERSLVERMKTQPFALVGVNSERTDDPAALKQNLITHQINWRSFKNKRPSGGTTIAAAYQVRGYPSLFLIDHKGVIREKWVGNPGDKVIDERVDELVKEAAEAAAKGKK